ncbi:MAG: 1-acyl-sn-glycerol-3-phosphate acyltransferase [Chloroflexota bacterium]
MTILREPTYTAPFTEVLTADPVAPEKETLPAEDYLTYTTIPEVGPSVPRRGNRFSRDFFYGIMRAMGWRIEGVLPDVPKIVLVGAPHTANQDFFMSVLTALSVGVDMKFVMKHTAFKGVVGSILRYLGGIGLDRDKTRNFVQQSVDQFNMREQMILALMPEGTRSVTAGWRSGFYYIAHGAGAVLVLITLDYSNKVMRVGPTIVPTGDYASDLPRIQSHYIGVMGKYPERTLPLPTE